MRKLEYKSLPLQLTDLSTEHRTAVIAHAAYDNIDRLGDVSRKGMFNKSWAENKGDIGFYLDHKASQQPGIASDFWENDTHAFTKVQFAKTTLGNDVMEMTDMGIIKGASFGFAPIISRKTEMKGKTVRELKEVYHGETSLIHTLTPINPKAGVVSVTKAEEEWVLELKAHLETMEKFCRSSKASDECIKLIEQELKAAQTLISQYDTAYTPDEEPDVSVDGNGVATYADKVAVRGRRRQLVDDDNDPENEPDDDGDELLQRLALLNANI